MVVKIALAILFSIVVITKGQENAGVQVAKALQECYNTTEYLNRDSRPPVTMNVVIELLRKIENGKSKKDARQLSEELLHRFRQDGIVKLNISNNLILPYRPDGLQAPKNKILLENYIPGDAKDFPNGTLTSAEACSLHFMMSNTVEEAQRGDEGLVCNSIGRYMKRTRRDVTPPKKPQMPSDVEPVSRSRPRYAGERSQCPIESGVVYTRWGGVQLGTVMAGIATGFANQKDLITQDDETYEIDSSFAATLAGDIAEVAIHLGIYNGYVKVGAAGVWNSTTEPRYYFINDMDFAMTDAELRAGADGLILAKYVDELKSKQSLIKLSQILDMYYSSRGILSNKYRACARRELVTDVVSKEQNLLQDQCVAFSLKYNKFVTTLDNIKNLTSQAIDKFFTYTANMADLKCQTEEPVQRAAADLVIFLDTTFEYQYTGPSISYLLDNLDLNPFGSNVTILNGEDGSVIVNSTSSLIEYFSKYNRTTHLEHPRGFKYTQVYNKLEEIVKNKANENKAKNNVGGRSLVFLLMPSNNPSSQDNSFISERMQLAKSHLPAFHTVVVGRASKDAYSSLVFESNYDVFQLRETTSGSEVASIMSDVVKRIKQYPRIIANPKCGSNWANELSSNTLDQYIEPNSTNTYSIAPNYLFGEQEKTLKIRFQTTSAVVNVCFPNGECKPGSSEISYPLTNYCADYEVIKDCPPFKFTVSVNETRVTGCTDPGCRFPDNAKYTISIDGLGCASSSSTVFASLLLISIAATFCKLF